MNVKEAMMDSVAQKLDLSELGTRYDHYMELKEVFLLGIDVVDRMRPTFISESDRVTKAKLENAVEMIDKRLRYLSDYDDKIFSVRREVIAAGIHRSLQLTEGSDAQKKDGSSSNNSTNQSNPPNQR